jgi:hypothetical protein
MKSEGSKGVRRKVTRNYAFTPFHFSNRLHLIVLAWPPQRTVKEVLHGFNDDLSVSDTHLQYVKLTMTLILDV